MLITPINARSAERRRSLEPLRPPEFPQSPFGFNQGDERRGEAIYRQNACSSCHLIEGRGGKIGPDLSRIGENRRLVESYRQHLIKDHQPRVTLPERDMDDLIAYLQSLKLLR
jgi:cytochrome c2